MKIGFKRVVGIKHGHISSDFIKEPLLVLIRYLLRISNIVLVQNAIIPTPIMDMPEKRVLHIDTQYTYQYK